MAGVSSPASWRVSSSRSLWLIRKKLLARLHRTGPLLSGTSIRFCRRATRIHFRNNFFVPLTITGEHPTPISGFIAPRRWSSSLNQPAHSGTTGKPNRCEIRNRTNVGSLSHRMVRLPPGSAPGRVLSSSAEIATKWRIGLHPAIVIVPRKHWASSPRVTVTGSIPEGSRANRLCSMTAAQMKTVSEMKTVSGTFFLQGGCGRMPLWAELGEWMSAAWFTTS